MFYCSIGFFRFIFVFPVFSSLEIRGTWHVCSLLIHSTCTECFISQWTKSTCTNVRWVLFKVEVKADCCTIPEFTLNDGNWKYGKRMGLTSENTADKIPQTSLNHRSLEPVQVTNKNQTRSTWVSSLRCPLFNFCSRIHFMSIPSSSTNIDITCFPVNSTPNHS